MWPLFVMVAMTAAIGSFVITQQSGGSSDIASIESAHVARNMALYRDVLVDYVRDNPRTTGTVRDSALKLPDWYVRHPAWTNRVMGDGLIIVYARESVPPGVMNEISKLAQGSMLNGKKKKRNNGKSYLHSPRHGDVDIELPNDLPDDAPVWLAYSK